MIRVIVFTLFAVGFAHLNANAQESKIDNLSQLQIGIGYAPVLVFTPTTLDYTSSSMVRFTLGTNYLKGSINYNLHYSSLTPSNGQPDCDMFDNSMSYQYRVKLYKKLFVSTGLQIGINTIHFKGDSVSSGRSLESEISAGFDAGLQLYIGKGLGISCSYKLGRIFATPRNDLQMIDLGIFYNFKPNKTVKTWLE